MATGETTGIAVFWIVFLVGSAVYLLMGFGLPTGQLITTNLDECPYECCFGNEYQLQRCADPKICVDFRCDLRECPFECCVDDGQYSNTVCRESYEVCDNEVHQCITQATYMLRYPNGQPSEKRISTE